jgi:DNA helicase-4
VAIIACPECSNKISDRAEICPHCGLPRRFFILPNTVVIPSQDKFSGDYKSIKSMLIAFSNDWRSIFDAKRYISRSEAKDFFDRYSKYITVLNEPMVHEYIRSNSAAIGFTVVQAQKFLNLMARFFPMIEEHNDTFIEEKLVLEKDYFDNILKSVDPNVMLDDEQRRAVVMDEDYCLIVAGAGAGKTTTMAAKVKYLVEKEGVAPSDIMVISYTNKAIDELRDRINKKLGIPVEINTFHAFGYSLLRKGSDIPPVINNWSYKIIFECIEKQIYTNKRLLENVVMFLGYYFDMPDDALKFDSLNDFCEYRAAQDYETLKSRLGEYNISVINERTKRVSTITGEYLRSQQEVQIANFLYMNSIEYQYEKTYPYPIAGARKTYTPDFYIRQGELECYIEHFGITEQYRSNVFSPQQLKKYIKAIVGKRHIHKHCHTELIETYSAYSDGRPLIEHLKEELERRGFILTRRSDVEIYHKLAETSKDKYVYRLIYFTIEFIEKFKSNGYEIEDFDRLKAKQKNVRTNLYLDIAKEIYMFYQNRMRENNQIDFADMINDAEKMLREIKDSDYKPSYKYIIIDEFQDIARQRFNLTKSLVDATGAKVIAVGDDWQSIYAFAGSDITLFQKFLELMGDGKEMHITHTYRNSQELIDIAGGFVQKNPTQIKKRLISPKSLPNPIEVLGFDDGKGYRKNWCDTIERAVGRVVEEYGEQSSILMIGRYNFDRDQLIRYGEFTPLNDEDLRSKKYPKAKIKFLTAHSSKGLGYDNVILVNMIDTKFGFPSQLEDDPIMKLVVHYDTSLPFAEERRLFYVAMTRTKNKVYMVTAQNRPSRFVLELIRDYHIPHDTTISDKINNIYAMKCPICKARLKYEKNKNYGLGLYMCTNDPEVCDFMTNSKECPADIYKCPECSDGYMIVKRGKEKDKFFYGCTNFRKTPSCGAFAQIALTCINDLNIQNPGGRY